MQERLERFEREIRPHVHGWLGDRMAHLIDVFDRTQSGLGITGDIAEIGVHHGLFLLLLSAVRRDSEKVHGFDIFGRQDLNVDRSGSGARDVVDSHIRRFYPDEEASFSIHELDSTTVRLNEIPALLPNRVRLFSVDGGHTQMHVVNDLSLAQEVLAPGGLAILDDFLGPHWPEVTEGFYRFMANANRRLAPLLYFQNKLFLTTFSEHALMTARIREPLEAWLGSEIHEGLWKYVNMAGFQVLMRG